MSEYLGSYFSGSAEGSDMSNVSEIYESSLELYSRAFKSWISGDDLCDLCFAICLQNKATGKNAKKMSVDKFMITKESLFLVGYFGTGLTTDCENTVTLPVVQTVRIMCDSLAFMLMDLANETEMGIKAKEFAVEYMKKNGLSEMTLAIDSDKEFLQSGIFHLPSWIKPTEQDKEMSELVSSNLAMLDYIAKGILGELPSEESEDTNESAVEDGLEKEDEAYYKDSDLKNLFKFVNSSIKTRTSINNIQIPVAIPDEDIKMFDGFVKNDSLRMNSNTEMLVLRGINDSLVSYAIGFNDSLSVCFKFMNTEKPAEKLTLLISQNVKEQLFSCPRLYSVMKDIFKLEVNSRNDIEATKLLIKICRG